MLSLIIPKTKQKGKTISAKIQRLNCLYFPKVKWCQQQESNLRPDDYESTALPTELCWQTKPSFHAQLHL